MAVSRFHISICAERAVRNTHHVGFFYFFFLYVWETKKTPKQFILTKTEKVQPNFINGTKNLKICEKIQLLVEFVSIKERKQHVTLNYN